VQEHSINSEHVSGEVKSRKIERPEKDLRGDRRTGGIQGDKKNHTRPEAQRLNLSQACKEEKKGSSEGGPVGQSNT